jgi:hypothetical protein
MSARSDVKRLLRAARRAGLAVAHGGKHLKVIDPRRPGPFVTVSCTPSSRHALRAIRKDILHVHGLTL